MPVHEDFSIVPDSTASSSPHAVMTSPVKRAVRTYGRARQVDTSDDSYISSVDPTTSSGSRDSVYRTGRLDGNEEIPPSSDPARSFPDAEHADDETDETFDDAPRKFDFGWKKKLKEMDEQEDFDVEMMDTAADANTPHSPRSQFALSRKSFDREPHDIPTSPADHDATALEDDVFGGSLNTLTASSSPSPSANVRSLSPQPRRRLGKGTRQRVVVDSDSEDETNKRSSPSPSSPSFPHAITTPKSHSFPTPPTSEDSMAGRSKTNSKGKGKEVARPHVAPLRFSEEAGSTSLAKPKKAASKDTRSQKAKVKAPTKKELLETQRDRVRLAADRQISIPRPKTVEAKYTVQSLLASIAPNAKPLQREQSDPDPIGEFTSSPAQHVAPESPTLRQEDGSPIRISPKAVRKGSPLKAMASIRDLGSDSDDMDLPEVGMLVAEEQEKHDKAEKQRKLLETKKALLAAQSAKPRPQDDSDDDLVVVQSVDMQMAVKEEDAERKSGRKKRVSEGRKRQLNMGGISLSKQKAKESPQKSGFSFIGLAGASQRGKKGDGQMTSDDLNKYLAKRVETERMEVVRKKEEEWLRRGGKVNTGTEGALSSIQEASKLYAEKGLKVAEKFGTSMDLDDEEDEGDDDWTPDRPEERGSASPSPQPQDSDDEQRDGYENEDLEEEADTTMVNDEDDLAPADDEDTEDKPILKKHPRRSMAKHNIVNSDSEPENDENAPPPRPIRRLLSPNDSGDDNVMLPPLPKPVLSHRGSLSSLDGPTEDEGDKENDTSRMFDRSEDKENKAVVRHGVGMGTPGPSPSFRAKKGSLFGLERGITRELSLSPSLGTRDVDADDERENDEDRQPLKDLLDDDPFSPQAGPSKRPGSFAARLQQASPVASFPLAASLELIPLIAPKTPGFSQFPDEEPAGVFGGGAKLQPGFSDLFELGTERQKGEGTAFKRPLGDSALSQSFSDEAKSPTHRSKLGFAPSLGLTQDVALAPAFEVGGNLLRKADQIFEKEQEYLLEAAIKKPQREPELYVNDHGFLTQTRPDVSSPEIYRPLPPTQTQTPNLLGSSSSQRHPLRTISLADSVDFDSPQSLTLRRLRKRSVTPISPLVNAGYGSSPSPSPSPSKRPVRNAFDVLQRGAQGKREKPKEKEKRERKLERSEFIENEAQESDDDEMLGFGMKRRADGEDEEDGEDLDQSLDTLVDDQVMDAETIGEELVKQKHMEHLEMDDQAAEKLHMAAVQGELRKKKRNHGVGFDDSDDESEDEANRKARRAMKKQKIDRDNIKELGENPQTNAFFQVYRDDIEGEKDIGGLEFLQRSQSTDVVMADQGSEEQDDTEEPEYVSPEELKRQLREAALSNQSQEVEDPLDPHDVSWLDRSDDEEESLRVKPVDIMKKKKGQQQHRRSGMDLADFDAGFEGPHPRKAVAEATLSKVQQDWARVEGRSRTAGNTGRNGGGAAVTGHRTKSAASGARAGSSRGGPAVDLSGTAKEKRKSLKAQPSLLASVAAERRKTRFG